MLISPDEASALLLMMAGIANAEPAASDPLRTVRRVTLGPELNLVIRMSPDSRDFFPFLRRTMRLPGGHILPGVTAL